MQPTPAEILVYSTVKLSAFKGGAPVGTGTGFYTGLLRDGDRSVPVVVTNKHVLKGADRVRLTCHLAHDGRPTGRFVLCQVMLDGGVFDHPDESVDLCAFMIGDLMHQARSAGDDLYCPLIGLHMVPSDDDWQYFDAIEEVTMVGCPRGITDEHNNLPIVRRGVTATSLTKRYGGRDEFLVDMACFPGSSGSPIFVYDRNGYFDRKENAHIMGATRLKLVGILFAGPLIDNNGQIILNQQPTVTVATMMHLGQAIRSSALAGLEAVARERVG